MEDESRPGTSGADPDEETKQEELWTFFNILVNI